MRKFFFAAAVFAVFFSLSAQDSTNDLYQQYLNQYKNNTPASEPAPAAAEPAKKEEAPAPAAAEPAKKEETPAPAAEQAKEEAPAAEETKEESAEQEKAAAEPEKAAEPGENLAFEKKPFFSIDTFGWFYGSVNVLGKDVSDDSYKFGIGNAVIDLKGGNHMFDARILVDLAKMTDDDGNFTTDFIKDVSLKMVHPSYRSSKSNFGLNVMLQAGRFGMPFGIENGYDHENTFANSALKDKFGWGYERDAILGGGFRDEGISLGVDFLFKNNMDFALTLFVFNGDNKVVFDGEDVFKTPAFGVDLRYNYKSRLYATAALSLVFGNAYRPYDEGSDFAENVYDGDVYVNGAGVDQAKKNIVMAAGLDIGYEVNDNITAGVKAEFAFSHRDLYNPDFGDGKRGGKLLFDGVFIAGSSYDTYGFFAMPYAKIYDFDLMARFFYARAPYYGARVADRDSEYLGVNAVVVYTFCDYASVELDYDYYHLKEFWYDSTTYAKTKGVANDHTITLALSAWFDFLWEGKEGGDEAEGE